MTIQEKYNISFQKNLTPSNSVFKFATTTNSNYVEIAEHLTRSDIENTEDQIQNLNDALNGLSYEEFWGEVLGSSLFVYLNNNTVEVGQGGTIIPLEDFKHLLEEWLVFIN